jgi:hypothetical protein
MRFIHFYLSTCLVQNLVDLVMNFYVHYKKSQFQEHFFVNSLYFRQDVFVNLFYCGNSKLKNTSMYTLKRSIHASLMGFFFFFINFFCFKLDLEEGVSNMMAMSKNGEYVIRLFT